MKFPNLKTIEKIIANPILQLVLAIALTILGFKMTGIIANILLVLTWILIGILIFTQIKLSAVWKIIVFIILGGLFYLGLWTKDSIQKQMVQQMIPFPKLKDLFRTDFSQYTKYNEEFTVDNYDSQGNKNYTIKIECSICFDFQSRSKFLLLYIPSNAHAYSICEAFPEKIDDIFTKMKGLIMESKFLGEELESAEDLVFTNKIYIYLDEEFSYSQKGQLSSLYKSKGLTVQFRGNDYALAAWYAKRLKNTAPTSSSK